MRRRDFFVVLGGAAAVWSLSARAQQPATIRHVGVLMGGADDPGWASRLAVFRQALEQLGWIEGRNVRFDIRWGAGDAERVTAHARELLRLQPDVILAGPNNALLPLQKETSSIPIVFVGVSDPLGQGIVQSLARPTGNVTGFSNLEFTLIGKWLSSSRRSRQASSGWR